MFTTAHRHEEVKNCPSQNNDVVNIHPAGHDSSCITDAFKERGYLEDSEAAYRKHLSESQLHEKHGYTGKKERQEVGNEESSATIFIAEIRKSPDIAKTNCQTDLEKIAKHNYKTSKTVRDAFPIKILLFFYKCCKFFFGI